MRRAFAKALGELDDDQLDALYGISDPLQPEQVAELLEGSGTRWWIAGGRAARAGSAARHHDDTDVAVDVSGLGALRAHLSDWDLWEAHEGTLRPLLPSDSLLKGREQLWMRRDSSQPWRLDILLDFSSDYGPDEWVFKKDQRIRVPWDRAVQVIDGISYLRPELALLHKAHLDRQKDRGDLAAARLQPEVRTWLADTLDELGRHDWAGLARSSGTPGAS
jgi:hypothetical protein